jgi:hypothetical protein
MQITLANYSRETDERVQQVVRAINRQLREDFQLYWSQRVVLSLGGNADATIDPQRLCDLRGDAIVYLLENATDSTFEGVLGVHDQNLRGVPFGFVFTEISDQLGEDWSITLSHEVLELVGDAEVNKLAAGPDPRDPDNQQRYVLHWFEMCDAVQDEWYEIDSVKVSNFVTPLYFTLGEQEGARNDFLNRSGHGGTLRSFGVKPGGYVGFLDPATGQMDTYAPDARSKERLQIKGQIPQTRRALRYCELAQRAATNRPVIRDEGGEV